MADHMVKMSEVAKGQRWQQFLDYYKYRVLFTVLAIIALIPLVYNNLFVKKPDVTLLAATGTEISEEVWAQASDAVSALTLDYNEDGTSLAFIDSVFADDSYQNINGELHMAYQTKLISLLQDATHTLQIVDEEMYAYLEAQESLATYGELPEALGHDPNEVIKIPLKSLSPFRDISGLPDNLFMTMRPEDAVNRGKHKGEPEYYDRQIAVLLAMME